MRRMLILLFSLLFVSIVSAQNDCPAIVQLALDATEELCKNEVGRNQICYGNVMVSAEAQDNVSGFAFESPGDIVDLVDVKSLNLSALQSPDEWGIALIKMQANLPDTLPGQNISMLMFGDVSIENEATVATPTVDLNATANANIRSGPGTDFRVIDSVATGDVLTAAGRNEQGDWLYITLVDGGQGWIFADLVSTEGDLNTLEVVDETFVDSGDATYGPMQAFIFQSAIGNPACKEAPQDGILVQTPSGAGTINLKINEVSILLGSTIFMQAAPSGDLTIYVLEGSVTASAFDETVTAPAGLGVRVPLDSAGVAAGEPELITFTEEEIAALPIDLLDEAIEIATPFSEEEMVEIASRESCSVSTSTADVRVHVGPGENRATLFFLPTDEDFEVVGQAEADDGSQWWKLDSESVAPDRDGAEIWVAQANVTSSGDCTAIANAAAPPINFSVASSDEGDLGLTPLAGTWVIIHGMETRETPRCFGAGETVTRPSGLINLPVSAEVSEDGNTMTMTGNFRGSPMVIQRSGGSLYTGTVVYFRMCHSGSCNPYSARLTLVSETLMQGQYVESVRTPCNSRIEVTMQRQ